MGTQEVEAVSLRVGTLAVSDDGTLDGKCEVRIDGHKIAWEHLRIIMNRGEKTRIILDLDPTRKRKR